MADPVLIIGAGPVGLTMAAELARYGVPLRIIDQAAARTDKSKALVIWSRTLELLEQAGAVAPFIKNGHKLLAADMYAGAQQIGRIDFTGIRSTYAYALLLPQSKTEELLESHLEDLGVRVERQVELIDFTAAGEEVEATLRDARGAIETARANWLIGCDGAHSLVRHKLDLKFEGATLQSDFMLADVHLDGWPVPETELALYWHADGVLGAFPISPGRFRIIADVGAATGDKPQDPDLAQVQAIVEQRGPGGVTVRDPVWLSGFRINERKVTEYRKGRAFLVGDAAHVHSPAGGQGMNTGMQDAFNLAWKLAMVCHHEALPGRLLDSYSAERSAVGKKVLADAGHLTALATLRNPLAQGLRNIAGGMLMGLTKVKEAMARNFSEIAISYPDSPLNGPRVRGLSDPAPGERLPPDPDVRIGTTPKFFLHAARSAALDRLVAHHGAILAPDLRPALHANGVWMIRPDGYVAAVANADDIDPLERYLESLIQ